jgi:tripartite-type tricarboxylate transporter receptor subunit TctC
MALSPVPGQSIAAVVAENHPAGDAVPANAAFVNAHNNYTLFSRPRFRSPLIRICKTKCLMIGEIVPIARMSNTILVIAVPAALKVGSMQDLAAVAKASQASSIGRPSKGLSRLPPGRVVLCAIRWAACDTSAVCNTSALPAGVFL